MSSASASPGPRPQLSSASHGRSSTGLDADISCSASARRNCGSTRRPSSAWSRVRSGSSTGSTTCSPDSPGRPMDSLQGGGWRHRTVASTGSHQGQHSGHAPTRSSRLQSRSHVPGLGPTTDRPSRAVAGELLTVPTDSAAANARSTQRRSWTASDTCGTEVGVRRMLEDSRATPRASNSADHRPGRTAAHRPRHRRASR